MTAARVLRSNALLLALFGLSGLASDLLAYVAGVGALGERLRGEPLTIGLVEAHGLAVVVAVLLFRLAATPDIRLGHAAAVATHLLLGTSNVVFWQVFVDSSLVPLGVVATTFHLAYVTANAVALAAPTRHAERRRPDPVGRQVP